MCSNLEKHKDKCYNADMNDLGILSDYSAFTDYTQKAGAAYGASRISGAKNIQEDSDTENTFGRLSVNNEINDEAVISDEAKKLLAAEEGQSKNDSTAEESKNESTVAPKSEEELTPEQKQQVAELKARDEEVKAHEQAHRAAAAGISASAPNYEYETGPDGEKYAVGGEVNISFVQSSDPDSNIANARTMKNAALAPSEPSSQDMAVARKAEQIIVEAKQEKTQQQQEDILSGSDESEKSVELGESDKSTDTETIESSGALADASDKTNQSTSELSKNANQASPFVLS